MVLIAQTHPPKTMIESMAGLVTELLGELNNPVIGVEQFVEIFHVERANRATETLASVGVPGERIQALDLFTLGIIDEVIAKTNTPGAPIGRDATVTMVHARRFGEIMKLEFDTLISAGLDNDTALRLAYDKAYAQYDPAEMETGIIITGGMDDDDPNAIRLSPADFCFAAGTSIKLADGSEKPIERIRVGDMVMAFDPEHDNGRGGLVPKRVTRTYVNHNQRVIDFHGTLVTPGHVYLTDGGIFKPLMDIIREDGVVIRDDGCRIRAATNCEVGSEGDQFVQIAYITEWGRRDWKATRARAGTLRLKPDGTATSFIDYIERHRYTLLPNGLIVRDGEQPHPLPYCGPAPRPEDYVLQKSGLTLADLYDDGGDGRTVPPRPSVIAGGGLSNLSDWSDVISVSGGDRSNAQDEADGRVQVEAVQHQRAGEVVH
ncbi:MAG: hypothetical protein GY791_15425 [Alphaproteobacteria bacterium]|nr:hypothetical protein [Alphaproteobacteria bacterium]